MPPNPQEPKPKIVNVPADGNCFYLALYRAARDRGVVDSVLGSFWQNGRTSCLARVHDLAPAKAGARVAKKDTADYQAMLCMRAHLEAAVRRDGSGTARRMYKNVVQGAIDEESLYEVADEEVADFLVPVLGTFVADRDHYQRYLDLLADHIATPDAWVSEVEVSLAREVLRDSANIGLRVLSHDSKLKLNGVLAQLLKVQLGPRDLVLVNCGNAHYKYLALAPTAAAAGAASPGGRKRSPAGSASPVERKRSPAGSASPVGRKRSPAGSASPGAHNKKRA